MHNQYRKKIAQPQIPKKEVQREVAKIVTKEMKHEMKKGKMPKYKDKLHAMA